MEQGAVAPSPSRLTARLTVHGLGAIRTQRSRKASMYNPEEDDIPESTPPTLRDERMLLNLMYYSFCRVHQFARALIVLDKIEAEQLLHEDRWGATLGN